MGAVTSREGYELQGKNFCEEIFHFFQNDGLPTLPHPPPPKKKKEEEEDAILTLCPFKKLSSDSQRFPHKIFAVYIVWSPCIPQYIFQRIGSTAQKGSDWGGSKGYSL